MQVQWLKFCEKHALELLTEAIFSDVPHFGLQYIAVELLKLGNLLG